MTWVSEQTERAKGVVRDLKRKGVYIDGLDEVSSNRKLLNDSLRSEIGSQLIDLFLRELGARDEPSEWGKKLEFLASWIEWNEREIYWVDSKLVIHRLPNVFPVRFEEHFDKRKQAECELKIVGERVIRWLRSRGVVLSAQDGDCLVHVNDGSGLRVFAQDSWQSLQLGLDSDEVHHFCASQGFAVGKELAQILSTKAYHELTGST